MFLPTSPSWLEPLRKSETIFKSTAFNFLSRMNACSCISFYKQFPLKAQGSILLILLSVFCTLIKDLLFFLLSFCLAVSFLKLFQTVD